MILIYSFSVKTSLAKVAHNRLVYAPSDRLVTNMPLQCVPSLLCMTWLYC